MEAKDHKIVVIGGSGKVGAIVLQHLQGSGYQVKNVDRQLPREKTGYPTLLADVREGAQVHEAVRGADAIVHLAGHPTSGIWPENVVFRENTQITYNVLEAASHYGIPRVVFFSTMAVFYYPKPAWYAFKPEYLPVDETHPFQHHNAYSLSKQAGEATADMFSRLGGTVPVTLRPPWIVLPGEIRAKGLLDPQRFEEGLDGLWSYVDGRDVARAVQLAIEVRLDGHEVFNLSAADTCCPLPTREMVQRLWPELGDFRDELSGYQPLIDTRKARRLLGYRPIYSARDELS
jgi:nucleoside-diphosphate-sugar epimerase